MRKLILQVQLSVDGFVGGPNGELDWMTWNLDDSVSAFINSLTDRCDTILLGRNMTDGFVNYWESVVNNQPGSPECPFALKMVNYPKIVFSRTITESNWNNTTIATGDFVSFIKKLKEQPGKDIIVYGGAGFVSSLIKEGMIDEFNLFYNPVLINKGLQIFGLLENRQKLTLLDAVPYSCGVSVIRYQLNQDA